MLLNEFVFKEKHAWYFVILFDLILIAWFKTYNVDLQM